MTCIHHYDITESIFTALKFSVLCLFTCHHPQSLEITDFFTVSIALPFPKYLMAGIIQHAGYSGWHLSLSKMYLSFLHVFSWPESSCSSVHGALQARILKWVAFPPPGGLPDPGMEPTSLLSSSIDRRILSH